MSIVIKQINSEDPLLINKLNFNFNQIMLSGGGPKGPKGATGIGLPGIRGKRGLNFYTENNIPIDTFKDDLFLKENGDVFIIGATGATTGVFSEINLKGLKGATGATGVSGYAGGIESYKADDIYDNGLKILINEGATGANNNGIGFIIQAEQRINQIFCK